MVWIIAVIALVGCGQFTTDTVRKDTTATTDALLREMKEYFGENQGLIEHTLAVYEYAEQIRQVEGGDILTVRAAAICHDIGIPKAKRVHGSAAGKFQQIEGPPIARRILTNLGLEERKVDHICRIIANHHTAHDDNTVATIEFKIVWDADALVNLRRRRAKTSKEKFSRIIKETFRTTKGLQIAEELYLTDNDKDAGFDTKKEIQHPVCVDIEEPSSADFSGQVKLENHYESANLKQCRFEWKLAELPTSREDQHAHTVLAEGAGPGIFGGKAVFAHHILPQV
jgi:putative nucleotidyltransferase with HDIG domain